MKKQFILSVLAAFAFLGCGDHDSSGEFEYVALGASDATGIGASPLTNGYVYKVQEGVQGLGYDVGLLNFGIPGVETDEIRKTELPLAIEEEPELVTLFTGANDITSGISDLDFQNDLGIILSDLSNKTEALIFVATIPDLTQLPKYQESPDSDVTKARVDRFNQIIREEASKNRVTVVELSDEPISSVEVSDDGFHPNDAGHQHIAEVFLQSIRSQLGPNPGSE